MAEDSAEFAQQLQTIEKLTERFRGVTVRRPFDAARNAAPRQFLRRLPWAKRGSARSHVHTGRRRGSSAGTLGRSGLVGGTARVKSRLQPHGGIVTSCPLGTQDVASPESLPEVGKWMLDPSLSPAHWIGEILVGKALREPINVLILDPLAGSLDESKRRLTRSCSQAGYPSREGHSSGYSGCIGGELYGQLPEGNDDAFSDAPFVVDNNHGRIFGPFEQDGQYLFIGAFSRERVVPLAKVRHQYVSFNRARDDFAQKLAGNGTHEVRGYVNLDNVLIEAATTTGDHDGIAVSLVAVA